MHSLDQMISFPPPTLLPLSVSFFCFLPLPLDDTSSLWADWWFAEAARTWISSTGSTGFVGGQKRCKVQALV